MAPGTEPEGATVTTQLPTCNSPAKVLAWPIPQSVSPPSILVELAVVGV